MIYLPREDSYLIEKFVKRFSKNKKILDVGAGSGILSRAAAKSGAKKVLAVDIDKESVEHCKKKGIDVRQSDLFSKVKEKFDLIVFNPPYLPKDEREDFESSKSTAGGKRGDEIILRFLKGVRNFLEKNGIILIVLSSLTPKSRIKKILKKNNLKKEVLAHGKYFFETFEVWKLEELKTNKSRKENGRGT